VLDELMIGYGLVKINEHCFSFSAEKIHHSETVNRHKTLCLHFKENTKQELHH